VVSNWAEILARMGEIVMLLAARLKEAFFKFTLANRVIFNEQISKREKRIDE
jgi:hypothetical protein